MRKRFNKLGIESDMAGWIAIGVAVLVIAAIGFLRWKGIGGGAIDQLGNLFRLKA